MNVCPCSPSLHLPLTHTVLPPNLQHYLRFPTCNLPTLSPTVEPLLVLFFYPEHIRPPPALLAELCLILQD